MRLVPFLVLLASLPATQTAALSCLRPSVQASFREAQAAEATYVLALGRLAVPGGSALPPAGYRPGAKPYSVEATFEGMLATLRGFDRPARVPVAVEVGCAGPWCGAAPVDQELLFFLERRGDGFALEEGACPRWALGATPEAVDAALSCLRGEGCAPE